MRNTALLLVCVALGTVSAVAGQGQLEVAGKLAVDIHAELLVAVDDEGHAVNWYNCGGLWGTFGDFGFDGPRDQYPKLGKVDGVEAVVFDGSDRLRLDIKAPASITDGDFSVEVWASNPSAQSGECLVSWAGGMALDCGRAPADGGWHHVALVYGGGIEKLLVDGKVVDERKPKRALKPGGTIAVGCDADGKRGFSGAIAAVRIHEKAMTEAQVRHNVTGGVRLGADLVPNIAEKPRGILFADNSKDPNIACRTSKHFRTCWEKDRDTDGKVAARIAKQLEDAEFYYEVYARTLGMHLPIVSDKIENRGDGRKYLIEICNNWKGGNFGGHMPHGFGYPIQGPGYLSGHELAHAVQMHSMGCFPGNWWEAHANWMPEAAGRPHVQPGLNNKTSMFFMGHGRHYYHCWLIFQHLAQTPEYGPLFVARMWHHFRRGEGGKPRYHWALFHTIDPDPATPLADEMAKMACRNITWDYAEHDRYAKANDDPDMARYGRTLLEPVLLERVWRVPWDMAPQQFGYNICPLMPSERTVTVELQGYVNPERGSDWRACLVAVDKGGKPRYSAIWGQGKGTITLARDERKLYLVVVATPTKILEPPMVGDYRSFEQHHFPYTVRLEGAEPLDVLIPEKPEVPGGPHPNGGGFVAKSATVEPTAYVAPHAQVLDRAKVLGRARIEDVAVVRGQATVRDHAVVSGHALVERDAVVRDHAKVRGFAKADGTVRDFAKVLEHGFGGRDVSGYAVLKGQACARRSIISGTTILDGSYNKANDIDKGVWLTWSWGAGKNPGELDQELGGLYCQYTFEKPHPYLAWDTYGTTHGYLVGKPSIAAGPRQGSNALALNGKDQYVELPRDVADMHDITIDVEVKWDGGTGRQRIFEFAAEPVTAMYLTPSSVNGKVRFAIYKSNKSQALVGKAPLPVGKWTRVQVMLAGDTGRLFVDGEPVARNDAMTMNPDDLRATVCMLGRGWTGRFFKGQIGEFSVYSVALVDEVPPTPDPAAWSIEPTLIGPAKAMMRATAGNDPRGQVEYRFEETTDGPGADDSDWQASPIYEDAGLKPGATYAYRVTMRDVNGNQTKPSEPVQVTWKEPEAFVQGGNGLVVMEAEHFHHNVPGASGHAWKPARKPGGFTGEGAMAALPDKGGQNDGNFSGLSPRLDYTVRFARKARHWLWVRTHAHHYTADSLHAGLGLKEQDWGRNIGTPWGSGYQWARSKPFDVPEPGIHRLSLWMREDGLIIDRLLLTTDGGYKPSDQLDKDKNPIGEGPPESQRR